MSVEYFIIALIGYLFGCSNLAFFLGKAKGFDIRSLGSNNAGASNATITMGITAGIMVGIHDIAKSFAAAFLASIIFPSLPGVAAVAGVSAVIGHIYPFYLAFRGGKGFASFLGLTLALDWRFCLAILLVILLVTVITDYIVLATMTTIVSFPVYLLIIHVSPIIIGAVCVASLVIFIKHFINIKRLCTGEEIGLRRAMSKQDKVNP